MRSTLVLAVMISAALVWAQSAPPQTPPAGGKAQTAAGAASARRPVETPPQRMRNLQQQLQQMRVLLAKMRAEAAAVPDATGKQLAQDNIEMWEMMLNHLQDEMLSAMQPPAAQPRPSAIPPKQQ